MTLRYHLSVDETGLFVHMDREFMEQVRAKDERDLLVEAPTSRENAWLLTWDTMRPIRDRSHAWMVVKCLERLFRAIYRIRSEKSGSHSDEVDAIGFKPTIRAFEEPTEFTLGFSVEVGSLATDWMRQNQRRIYTLAMRGMRLAWSKLDGDEDAWGFQAACENGLLHLSVPGNACGLDPEYGSKSEAYELTQHNLDTAAQLLTLFAGIAAIDGARMQS